MIRSESTSALGQPSETKPTLGVFGLAEAAALVAPRALVGPERPTALPARERRRESLDMGRLVAGTSRKGNRSMLPHKGRAPRQGRRRRFAAKKNLEGQGHSNLMPASLTIVVHFFTSACKNCLRGSGPGSPA